MTTSDDKGKQLEESAWVHKAPTKETEFDLERMKDTFMEAKKSFTETSTSGSKDQLEPEMDPSMLSTFLETCMKLLHDSKEVKGLQEIINRCRGVRRTTCGPETWEACNAYRKQNEFDCANW